MGDVTPSDLVMAGLTGFSVLFTLSWFLNLFHGIYLTLIRLERSLVYRPYESTYLWLTLKLAGDGGALIIFILVALNLLFNLLFFLKWNHDEKNK